MSALTWQSRNSQNAQRKNWPTEVQEETRQHFANVLIQDYQRDHPALTFVEVLHAFRAYGEWYDSGYRLRDVPRVA